MRKWIIMFIFWGACFVPFPVAAAGTILYVPIDDRPVSLDYTVDTTKAANLTVLVPPTEYLASRDHQGDPEKLWQWVNDHCQEADSLVLSTDSLIYGGLVDSRTHQIDLTVLQERLSRFQTLKDRNPFVKMYVFGTIMRSPQQSSGGVEPPYYAQYGPCIFDLTALTDKAEIKGLSVKEQQRLKQDRETIPPDDLAEWLSRREKNLKINAAMLELARNHVFDYVILGRDDSAPYSQAHREWRSLQAAAADLSASVFESFPGADQLGMILMARAYNDLTGQLPFVKIDYTTGNGATTIPRYEDQPIGATIRAHVIAAGGIVLANPQFPDLILAVNTPGDGVTYEADSKKNKVLTSRTSRELTGVIQSELTAGRQVAVADVAFSNGADNALMNQMFQKQLLARVSAYSGWNTASNKVGYAVAQGMMAGAMNEHSRQQLLAVRYLEDWAYQANIRSQLQAELTNTHSDLQNLDGMTAVITYKAEQKERAFAGKYLWITPEQVNVTFPWNRTFEIKIELGS
jgi:hypothetical protein